MRVFKPTSAYERAQREVRERQREHIRSLSNTERIAMAKRQMRMSLSGGSDKAQGFMRSSKAYADTAQGTRLYQRAYAKRPETIERADRMAPTLPREYIPKVRGERDKNTMLKILEYSGVSRK